MGTLFFIITPVKNNKYYMHDKELCFPFKNLPLLSLNIYNIKVCLSVCFCAVF